ncbi:hypothetical protein TWF481_008704 [Arthrobotrys musiformis]|uniref:Extracellular membrane protein CFEM domain-containing protein n=1 Tax=Arthrobotrys musiformis TaxID=47236 RepID=A0AAV9W7Z2_9PEZI
MWLRNLIISLSSLLIILSTVLAQDETVTIYSAPALELLRPCASTCMNETDIAGWLRCRTPLMNGCFCRRGLTSIGRASLFDCAKAGCNGDYEIDANSLTAVYTSYCNVYLAAVSPASTTARTTSSGTTLQTTNTVSTSTSTETSVAETTEPTSGGLSAGGKIGLGVGLAAGAIIALIASGVFLLRRQKARTKGNDAFKGIESEGGSEGISLGSPVAELETGGRTQRSRSELESVRPELE